MVLGGGIGKNARAETSKYRIQIGSEIRVLCTTWRLFMKHLA